jgi:hypothetical protein
MVPGRPRVVGAAIEPSGFSPGVSQRELGEIEGGFPKVELLLTKPDSKKEHCSSAVKQSVICPLSTFG